MEEELRAGLEEISLPASGLVLRGSLLTKLARKRGEQEAVHNLAEFDEITLEKRREYPGKWLVIFALISGVFFLWERTLPLWVCAPFFLLAALIVFAWLKVGVQYLVLSRGGKSVEYRLRDTPSFVTDFFEHLSENVRSVNPKVRCSVASDVRVKRNE